MSSLPASAVVWCCQCLSKSDTHARAGLVALPALIVRQIGHRYVALLVRMPWGTLEEHRAESHHIMRRTLAVPDLDLLAADGPGGSA